MVWCDDGEMMKKSIAQWFILPILSISFAIWLGVSSITANALHVLAKSGYAFNTFGSVSVGVVVVAIGCALALSAWLIATTNFASRDLMVNALIVVIWALIALAASALGDEFLNGLGWLAILAWVVEVAVATALSWRLFPCVTLWQKAQGAAIVCAWLAAVKALFLVASPGVVVHM